MKNQFNRLAILSLVASSLFVSSCYRHFYSASNANVPLHDKRGDIRVNGSIGSYLNKSTNLDFQASGAITNNIGILYNYMRAHKGDVDDPKYDHQYSNHHELGVGYFRKINNKFQWEVYGGYGQGSQFHKEIEEKKPYTNHINQKKIFLQPALGFKYKNLEIFGFVGLNRFIYNKTPGVGYDYDLIYKYHVNDAFGFYTIEPGYGLRFGLKDFKFTYQVTGFKHYIDAPNFKFTNENYTFPQLKISLGVSINLNVLNFKNSSSI